MSVRPAPPPPITEEMLYHYMKAKAHGMSPDFCNGTGGVYIYDRAADRILFAPIMRNRVPLDAAEFATFRTVWENYMVGAYWHTWVGENGATREPTHRRLFTEYDVGEGVTWMIEAQIINSVLLFGSPRILCDAEDVRLTYRQEEEPERATVSYIHG